MESKNKTQRPTIVDVAQLAGVSISTVSRVINNTAPVSANTADKVLDAIKTLNYRPQAAARVLASRKTETIGLLLPIISGDFFAAMLRGIERGTIEGGFDLIIHSTHLSAKPDDPLRRVLGEHNTDGLIVFSDSLDEKELIRLHRINHPVVLLHRSSPPGLKLPSVTVENKKGARSVVEHLIEVHHRKRIVFIRGPEKHEDSYWREMGYREALRKHSIPYTPDLIEFGDFNTEEAEHAIQRLLHKGIAFDAVFAGDDDSASGVYTALQNAGIQIPNDVSVVGFDNANLSKYLVPPLTTVHAHIEEAGYAASQLLVRLIKTGQANPITLLPTELVIRQSCGCP